MALQTAGNKACKDGKRKTNISRAICCICCAGIIKAPIDFDRLGVRCTCKSVNDAFGRLQVYSSRDQNRSL